MTDPVIRLTMPMLAIAQNFDQHLRPGSAMITLIVSCKVAEFGSAARSAHAVLAITRLDVPLTAQHSACRDLVNEPRCPMCTSELQVISNALCACCALPGTIMPWLDRSLSCET